MVAFAIHKKAWHDLFISIWRMENQFMLFISLRKNVSCVPRKVIILFFHLLILFVLREFRFLFYFNWSTNNALNARFTWFWNTLYRIRLFLWFTRVPNWSTWTYSNDLSIQFFILFWASRKIRTIHFFYK